MKKKRCWQRPGDGTRKTSVMFLYSGRDSFPGGGDMIMKMDRIYDFLDYPQSELKIREWDDREKWTGTSLESSERWYFGEDAVECYRTLYTGKAPFVYVETRFRRYGGWQGILQEGRKN